MRKSALAAVIGLAFLFASSTQPVFAQDFGMNKFRNDVRRDENQASKTARRQEQNLDNLQKRANKLIDSRIDSLNKVLARIKNDKRLSADEKASLSQDVQTTISGLTQLKAKIDADTDISVARDDAQKIITDFKVFAIFEPKIRLLVTIDRLLALDSKLSSLASKLQSHINKLKAQGKDVSKLQALLDDINSNLSMASSKLASDKGTVISISASSNPSVFAPIRQDLADVRSEFAQIRHDIGQMRVEFQAVIKASTNQSVSTSPSPSPLPTTTP